MRELKVTIVAVAAVALAGCQNTGYLLKTYDKSVAPKHVVETSAGTFWVFDRPDLHKMLTTPALSTMVGPSMISGLSAGLANVDPGLDKHREAAERWFKISGRKCEVGAAREVWRPEIEHDYTCS